MRHYLFCYIIFYAFAACTPEDKKIPKDILPIDKMKLIVWDMTQARRLYILPARKRYI